ncbi:MAG: ATP-binding protein [Ruminococcus sp.]|nr:ATP-binding protein [Ruminococcus sp.]
MFENMIDGIMTKTEEKLKINNSDYLEKGLWYCSKCHTPKQTRIPWLGEEKIVYCMCECEKEQYEQELKAKKAEEKIQKIANLRNLAFQNGSAVAYDYTFAKDNGNNPKMTHVAKKYVDEFEYFKSQGKGLLFFGDVGVGKSYIAACIANALIDKLYSVKMTNFVRIRNELQATYQRQEYLDSLNCYDLLILDDLSVESTSEYMQEIVFEVIDNRNRAKLPLIVTTNLTAEKLKHPVGVENERIFSRLLKMCHPIEFKGSDQRKQKTFDDFAEMQRILGI